MQQAIDLYFSIGGNSNTVECRRVLWKLLPAGRGGEWKGKYMFTRVKAPCPPILCPNILTREPSTCSKASNTVLGNSEEM